MFLVYGINRFASAELVYRFLFLVVARPLVSLSGLSSTIHAPRRPSRRRSRHDLGARTIDRGTLLKLLDLIRQLGPLDTWFYFLKAVCAPLQTALPIMQQHVLRCLVFGGQRSLVDEAHVAEKNRTELLVSVRLGRPTGTPLGQRSTHITPLEKVLGHQLITEGLCDILISWTYPNSWVAGQGALFHGPDALGLKVVEFHQNRAWAPWHIWSDSEEQVYISCSDCFLLEFVDWFESIKGSRRGARDSSDAGRVWLI
ncbi:unnamed protein product [Durusdinium trenchii]|uniref:ANK_REP_REGION domain-containing protein n=2 Tax=Durusdinium trenchii TaxID=1381693 RepID=A0ABP0RS77_9DINO